MKVTYRVLLKMTFGRLDLTIDGVYVIHTSVARSRARSHMTAEQRVLNMKQHPSVRHIHGYEVNYS